MDDDPGRGGGGGGPTVSVAGLAEGGHLVRCRGRLGIAAAITFRRLQRAARPVRPVLVLDLRGAEHTYRDARVALRALLTEMRRRQGTSLVVLPHDPVSVLALVGVPFQPCSDLAAAMAAVPRPQDLPPTAASAAVPTANERLVDVIARRRPSRARPAPVDPAPGGRPGGSVPPRRPARPGPVDSS